MTLKQSIKENPHDPTRENLSARYMELVKFYGEDSQKVRDKGIENGKWVCPFKYFHKVGIIFKKTLKEVHKSKILCPMCEYRDSSFMPCNACDDLGSEFKRGDKE